MSHTGISGDARRLLWASALTLILYLALGLAAAVLPRYFRDVGFPSGLPGRGETGRTDYPSIRLSLARPEDAPPHATVEPIIAAEPPVAGEQSSTTQDTDAGPNADNSTRIAGEQSSTGDDASTEEGTGSFGGSDGKRAGQTAGQTGMGAEADAARFSSWLEGAIRERLLYPERARKRGQEGSVLIELQTDADGQSGSAILQRSSGYAVLDRAALDLARTLFPAPVGPGRPWSRQIELVYRLDSASPLPKLTK